jgi:hypothetical protein
MDAQIEDIYSEQVKSRANDPRYARVLGSIARASQNTPLRADAVYFLANNIMGMILIPMAAARERQLMPENTPLISEERLFEDIESDLHEIIGSAAATTLDRDRDRISAASVIIGLGKIIDKLKINDAKLWGR